MSGVIKAGQQSLHEGVASVRFNFDDVTDKAQRYLQEVRREAAAIVERAKAEADEVRRRAEEEGRKLGMQAAERMLGERIDQQLAAAIPALSKAVDGVDAARSEWRVHWEHNLISLALAIAGRIVRREVAQDPGITVGWIRESLELASRSNRLTLRLNPRDRDLLGEQIQRVITLLGRVAETDVVADETIGVGGCKVSAEFGEIDHQIETQLQRIGEELQG